MRPTRALINLDNLAFNLRSSRSFMGDGPEVMAVVKANAYGHGAVECARRLEAEGVDWLAVAIPEEGLELRKAGLTRPILCLGGFWEGQAELIIANRITPVLFSLERAEELDRAAAKLGAVTDIHIKIDTGMGRLGIRPHQVGQLARDLQELKWIRVDGLLTHFSVADRIQETAYTRAQIETFNQCVEEFRTFGHKPKYLSMANSPGAVVHPDCRSNLVRLGGILYGLGGDVLPKGVPAPELKPVMRLETRVSDIKEFPQGASLGYGRTFTTEGPSRIALLPIGYDDGLPRTLSNKGTVLIRGKAAPIVGRISMDWTLADVTGIPTTAVNDIVTVIGLDGLEAVHAEDLAVQTDTISYEITCGIGKRVPRIYDQGA